jgi:hypothetical protein
MALIPQQTHNSILVKNDTEWNVSDTLLYDLEIGYKRGRSYPQEVVIRACKRLARGDSINNICSNLDVSKTWLYELRNKIKSHITQDGKCMIVPAPKKRGGATRSSMDTEQQIDLVDLAIRMHDRPQYKLRDDMNRKYSNLNVSTSTIQRCLKNADIKKVRAPLVDPYSTSGKYHEAERSSYIRAQYNSEIDPFSTIFIDETSVEDNAEIGDAYGYSKEKPVTYSKKGIGKTLKLYTGVMLKKPTDDYIVPQILNISKEKMEIFDFYSGSREQEEDMFLFWYIPHSVYEGSDLPGKYLSRIFDNYKNTRRIKYVENDELYLFSNENKKLKDAFLFDITDIGAEVTIHDDKVIIKQKHVTYSKRFINTTNLLPKKFILEEINGNNIGIKHKEGKNIKTLEIVTDYGYYISAYMNGNEIDYYNDFEENKNEPSIISIDSREQLIKKLLVSDEIFIIVKFLLSNGVSPYADDNEIDPSFITLKELKTRLKLFVAFITDDDKSAQNLMNDNTQKATNLKIPRFYNHVTTNIQTVKSTIANFIPFLFKLCQYIRYTLNIPEDISKDTNDYFDTSSDTTTSLLGSYSHYEVEDTAKWINIKAIITHLLFVKFPSSINLKKIKTIKIENNQAKIVYSDKEEAINFTIANIPSYEINPTELVSIKRALAKLPYSIAMDNAKMHGVVSTDQNKKSWIHTMAKTKLGLKQIYFTPALDPKFNIVELMFNFVKYQVEQKIRKERVGSVGVEKLRQITMNSFSRVRQEHLVKWLNIGCYQVPPDVLEASGLSEHIQLVSGNVVVNTLNNKLSHVNKRCQVLYRKNIPKYYRAMLFTKKGEDWITSQEWIPYTPGYHKNEADFIHVAADSYEHKFVHDTYTKEQEDILRTKGKLASAKNILSKNTDHRLAFLKNKRMQLINGETNKYVLRTYYTNCIPIEDIGLFNVELQRSIDKINDLYGHYMSKNNYKKYYEIATILANKGCAEGKTFYAGALPMLIKDSLFDEITEILEYTYILEEDDKVAREYMANKSDPLFHKITTDSSIDLLNRIRIEAVIIKAYAYQLASLVSDEDINKQLDKLQFSKQLSSKTNQTKLDIKFYKNKFLSTNPSSGEKTEALIIILNELFEFIEYNFKSYIIDLQNSIYNEQLDYGKLDAKKDEITNRTVSDIIIFCIELSTQLEIQLDDIEHNIVHYIYDNDMEEIQNLRLGLKQFVRKQIMILLDNPLGLCNLKIIDTNDTRMCADVKGFMVYSQKNGKINKDISSSPNHVLANISSNRKRIDPYKVKNKYNMSKHRYKDHIHKWGGRFAGYTPQSQQDEELFPEYLSKYSKEMHDDILNAWTYSEFLEFEPNFKEQNPPPSDASNYMIIEKANGEFEWTNKKKDLHPLLLKAKSRENNRNIALKEALTLNVNETDDEKKEKNKEKYDTYIIYEKKMSDDNILRIKFSTKDKLSRMLYNNVAYSQDYKDIDSVMILNSDTSKVLLRKSKFNFYNTLIVCRSKGEEYAIKYTESNDRNKRDLLYYTRKICNIENIETAGTLPLVTVKNRDVQEYFLIKYFNGWSILKQFIFDYPREMQGIWYENNYIICFNISKTIQLSDNPNQYKILSHNNKNEITREAANVVLELAENRYYELKCNNKGEIIPLSIKKIEEEYVFHSEKYTFKYFTKHVKEYTVV